MSDQPTQNQNDPNDFFEAAFHLLNPVGVLVRYTVHTSNANDCMKRQEFIIKNRLDGGYTVPAAGSGDGKSANDNPPQSQLCDGFMVVADVQKGKEVVYIKLPFKLANGESAQYPKQVMGSAVEMFLKAIADAGIEAQNNKLYNVPIKATWRQGKEMPKKNPDDPTKHYTDWISFQVLQKEVENKPPVKPPVKEPDPVEQSEDIPF